jgi:ATP-binding cassette subfamily F protein uup
LVVVSHDRTFLERTTERLVSVEPGGSVVAVAGGVEAWVARVEAGAGAAGPRAGGSGGLSPTASSSVAANLAPTVTRTPAGVKGPGPEGPPLGRLLRDAEKEMVRRQRQRDRITEALTVTADHQELTRLGDELAEAQRALDEVEERWLALAEAAESRG